MSHWPVMPAIVLPVAIDGNDAAGSAPPMPYPCAPVDGYHVPPADSQVAFVVFEDKEQRPFVTSSFLQPVVWHAAQLYVLVPLYFADVASMATIVSSPSGAGAIQSPKIYISFLPMPYAPSTNPLTKSNI